MTWEPRVDGTLIPSAALCILANFVVLMNNCASDAFLHGLLVVWRKGEAAQLNQILSKLGSWSREVGDPTSSAGMPRWIAPVGKPPSSSRESASMICPPR